MADGVECGFVVCVVSELGLRVPARMQAPAAPTLARWPPAHDLMNGPPWPKNYCHAQSGEQDRSEDGGVCDFPVQRTGRSLAASFAGDFKSDPEGLQLLDQYGGMGGIKHPLNGIDDQGNSAGTLNYPRLTLRVYTDDMPAMIEQRTAAITRIGRRGVLNDLDRRGAFGPRPQKDPADSSRD